MIKFKFFFWYCQCEFLLIMLVSIGLWWTRWSSWYSNSFAHFFISLSIGSVVLGDIHWHCSELGLRTCSVCW